MGAVRRRCPRGGVGQCWSCQERQSGLGVRARLEDAQAGGKREKPEGQNNMLDDLFVRSLLNSHRYALLFIRPRELLDATL